MSSIVSAQPGGRPADADREHNASVIPQIEALERLMKPYGTAPSEKRPPKVLVIWGPHPGKESTDMPRFAGVVASLSTKYTMFSPTGLIVRATASIKIKEAERLGMEGEKKQKKVSHR